MIRRAGAARLDLFAVAAPGLEPLVARELAALGLEPAPAEPGGVSFGGPPVAAYRANLWLRTASRVIARLGTFHARAFGELTRHASELPWERVLERGRPVRVRATAKKSRLYHTDAIAERIVAAIGERLGTAPPPTAARAEDGDDDASVEDDAQLVIVRLSRDACTVSVDTSGALLHRRGYRQAVARAPLRETLAAALLIASEWAPLAPLVDPLCGSGTIAIEGALLARRIAPGLHRRFAFMHWPDFDAAAWGALLAAARESILPAAPAPIQGSDRDAGAIEAARGNAERAGVAADVQLERSALSAIAPPAGPGWIATNPPYGHRIGDTRALRDLYAQLGNLARRRCPGWTLALISADPRLDRQIGMPMEEMWRSRNGGIGVRAMRATVSG